MEVRKFLKECDKSKVDIYISYLQSLEAEKDKDGKLKNYWFKNVTPEQYANTFKKVYETGLFIDGDSVTLNYRKKLIITYDYHAYKNKIMISYPETIFDFQVVNEGDEFSFKKESGSVIYSHIISNPFNNNKKIIGAYGIIKNRRGEFIEHLSTSEIEKMKNTSTMKNIWVAWYDRMVLKSIIKRICNVHFKDITQTIDIIDNETNEPERALISDLIQTDIKNAKTTEELTIIYNTNIGIVEDIESFINILGDRRKEIENDNLS